MDQEIFDVFMEEFNDMTIILENELNKYPSNTVGVNEIFRVFHTLKGNSATIEFLRLSNLTKYYCEYFRPKQNEKKLSEKEFHALQKCLHTLYQFKSKIKNGKKGKTIKIQPIIELLQ